MFSMKNYYSKFFLMAAAFLMSGTLLSQITVIGNGFVNPHSVTDDGVVALSTSDANYIWTADGGMVTVNTITNGFDNAGQPTLSADGTLLAATVTNPATDLNQIGLYNIADQTWEYLGGIGGQSDGGVSSAWSMNGDGSVIVGLGWTGAGSAHAVKWTRDDGMTDMGSTVQDRSSRANDVSADGSVIVGWQDEASGYRQGAYWINGEQHLLTDDQNNPLGEAGAVSADGQWTIGGAYGFEAWRYNLTTGEIFGIGHPDAGPFFNGTATAINADGSLITGFYRPFPPSPFAGEGFIWTEATGRMSIPDYLNDLGIDDLGISFTLPLAVSPDGTKIVGNGIDANNDLIIYLIELPEAADDCDQGDDSNNFENGYQIAAQSDYEHIDDFFVSPGNTLEIKSVVINVLAQAPIASIDLNFYDSNGDEPGSTLLYSVENAEIYAQPAIGSVQGYIAYAVHINVEDENLSFESGSYWMQPKAMPSDGIGPVFWEITTAGTLGQPIHSREAGSPWEADEDGAQGVFKLHCEVVEPPVSDCNFDIAIDVEPITRVVFSDVDNASDPAVNGSPALEDFTDIEANVSITETYEMALEGNTNGPWVSYFTAWIDWDQDGEWNNTDEMYPIGSITNSTGTDGLQAVADITVPADAPMGATTMRIIKNFGESPTDPCGIYQWGQAEDYTVIVGEVNATGSLNAEEISVYPNPTRDRVHIRTGLPVEQVTVYNITGQTVLTATGAEVDLSALPAAVYVMKVNLSDGSSSSFKIVKQ